jgi:hypothetical protein
MVENTAFWRESSCYMQESGLDAVSFPILSFTRKTLGRDDNDYAILRSFILTIVSEPRSGTVGIATAYGLDDRGVGV